MLMRMLRETFNPCLYFYFSMAKTFSTEGTAVITVMFEIINASDHDVVLFEVAARTTNEQTSI
jgi:hypothetical protein